MSDYVGNTAKFTFNGQTTAYQNQAIAEHAGWYDGAVSEMTQAEVVATLRGLTIPVLTSGYELVLYDPGNDAYMTADKDAIEASTPVANG